MTSTLVDKNSPSGYMPFICGQMLGDRTGQPSITTEFFTLGEWWPSFQNQTGFTNPDLRVFWIDVDQSKTSYRIELAIDPASVTQFTLGDSFSLPELIIEPKRCVPRVPALLTNNRSLPERENTSTLITPAEELRSLTRLTPAMLADLFGISRTTFYKWMRGATPRDERFQHLVDVLTHIKDARRRLPSSIEHTAWLRTPISPGAKTPLDYLRERRFSVFRGLVLRATSANMELDKPIPLSLPGPVMTPEERKIARERVSPSPRAEDDED